MWPWKKREQEPQVIFVKAVKEPACREGHAHHWHTVGAETVLRVELDCSRKDSYDLFYPSVCCWCASYLDKTQPWFPSDMNTVYTYWREIE